MSTAAEQLKISRSAARTGPVARLYGMKYSHPVLASRMALELTGLPFAACDVTPGLHGAVVRARGFPAWTVPALVAGDHEVQGSLAIARELHRLAPHVGLFPGDPEQRQAVEEAERFGHDEPQPIAHDDLRPAVARRACGRAALGLIPDYPRSGPDALPPVPAAIPPGWLPTAG